MTGKEGGSQNIYSRHDRDHTKIMTGDYFLTCSSTSIKRTQPLFRHPTRVLVLSPLLSSHVSSA